MGTTESQTEPLIENLEKRHGQPWKHKKDLLLEIPSLWNILLSLPLQLQILRWQFVQSGWICLQALGVCLKTVTLKSFSTGYSQGVLLSVCVPTWSCSASGEFIPCFTWKGELEKKKKGLKAQSFSRFKDYQTKQEGVKWMGLCFFSGAKQQDKEKHAKTGTGEAVSEHENSLCTPVVVTFTRLFFLGDRSLANYRGDTNMVNSKMALLWNKHVLIYGGGGPNALQPEEGASA
ncbi:uncharacterized protein LOC122192120 [Lagopus leucura]|uniref:uncharacterized protein LOC122192120 n=1 Tax=Lagopus leucura TaxID=30410 RepID=UPI001C67B845|nr:uncharacterized protein LOC122192120 [Lagopus leucura]